MCSQAPAANESVFIAQRRACTAKCLTAGGCARLRSLSTETLQHMRSFLQEEPQNPHWFELVWVLRQSTQTGTGSQQRVTVVWAPRVVVQCSFYVQSIKNKGQRSSRWNSLDRGILSASVSSLSALLRGRLSIVSFGCRVRKDVRVICTFWCPCLGLY